MQLFPERVASGPAMPVWQGSCGFMQAHRLRQVSRDQMGLGPMEWGTWGSCCVLSSGCERSGCN